MPTNEEKLRLFDATLEYIDKSLKSGEITRDELNKLAANLPKKVLPISKGSVVSALSQLMLTGDQEMRRIVRLCICAAAAESHRRDSSRPLRDIIRKGEEFNNGTLTKPVSITKWLIDNSLDSFDKWHSDPELFSIIKNAKGLSISVKTVYFGYHASDAKSLGGLAKLLFETGIESVSIWHDSSRGKISMDEWKTKHTQMFAEAIKNSNVKRLTLRDGGIAEWDTSKIAAFFQTLSKSKLERLTLESPILVDKSSAGHIFKSLRDLIQNAKLTSLTIELKQQSPMPLVLDKSLFVDFFQAVKKSNITSLIVSIPDEWLAEKDFEFLTEQLADSKVGSLYPIDLHFKVIEKRLSLIKSSEPDAEKKVQDIVNEVRSGIENKKYSVKDVAALLTNLLNGKPIWYLARCLMGKGNFCLAYVASY